MNMHKNARLTPKGREGYWLADWNVANAGPIRQPAPDARQGQAQSYRRGNCDPSGFWCGRVL